MTLVEHARHDVRLGLVEHAARRRRLRQRDVLAVGPDDARHERAAPRRRRPRRTSRTRPRARSAAPRSSRAPATGPASSATRSRAPAPTATTFAGPTSCKHAHGDDVHAVGERLAQAQRVVPLPALEVARVVAALEDVGRQVDERRRREAARVDGVRVDDRLERRPRLPPRLRRAVERPRLPLVAADERERPAASARRARRAPPPGPTRGAAAPSPGAIRGDRRREEAHPRARARRARTRSAARSAGLYRS